MTISYTLVRKNIKNVHIHVEKPDGRVVVTAPRRCPKSFIDSFVRSKQEWITQTQKKIAAVPEYIPGEDDKELLKSRVSVLLPELETLTGLHCSSWHSRAMKTRWGSCNVRTGRICLNLRLAKMDDCYLRYVLLHELCHLKVPNHSALFYAELGKYMPEYKAVQKQMKLLG